MFYKWSKYPYEPYHSGWWKMNIRFSNSSYLKPLLFFFKTFQNSLKKIYNQFKSQIPLRTIFPFSPSFINAVLSFEFGEGSVSLGCLLGLCHPTLMWHGGPRLSCRHLALVTANAFLTLLWFLCTLSATPNTETEWGETHDVPILPILFSGFHLFFHRSCKTQGWDPSSFKPLLWAS